MASAIGWYIHATRKGYEQHGIDTKGNQPNKGWITYSDTARSIMAGRMAHSLSTRANKLNNLTKQDKQQLQAMLSTLVQKVETGNFQQVVDEVAEAMGDELTNQLVKVNWDSLDVTLAKPQVYYVGRSKLLKNQSTILDTDLILGKIAQLQQALALRVKDNLITDPSVLQQADNLLTAYTSTIAKFKGAIPSKLKDIKNKQLKQELQNEYKELLDLITTYAAWPAVGLAKGNLFENTIGAILRAAEATGEYAIQNVLVTGGLHNEYMTYDKARFEGYDATNIEMVNARFYTDPKPVQGKVDVSFTWNAKDVRASLKNYNLANYTPITLVDNSPMAYMLQYEDTDFVNHYLNLWSTHKNADLSAAYKLRRIDAAKSMKLLLFYKALTGANLGGRNSANLLIINDTSKSKEGAVKVFTPQEIIDYVIRVNSAASVLVDGNRILEMPLLPNQWHAEGTNTKVRSMKAAQTRIANLLQELHNRKIYASISPTAFR